jgi:hypothetical protein
MTTATRLRFGALLTLGSVLAGCVPSQPELIPSGDRQAVPWMAKGLKGYDLLYVTNKNGAVNVYKYLKHTLVGVLTDFRWPIGACADYAGNVYVTDWEANKIVEYAHGGTKPIETIRDQFAPSNCSVNPVNGDLAVANYGNLNNRYRPGNIFIYARGKGKPVKYEGNDGEKFQGCAYDDRGDLLAAGAFGISGPFYTNFYYLPKLSKSMEPMDLPGPSNSWEWGGIRGLAWDGKYWVVDSGDLYRYSINVKAQYVDKIVLSDFVPDIWIYRKGRKSPATQIVGANGTYTTRSNDANVFYWNYPAGGSPIGTITKGLDAPVGITVSLKTGT